MKIVIISDFCSPFIVKELGKLNCRIHAVFGNNDGDKQSIMELVFNECKNITLHKVFGEIEMDKRKLAFIYYPALAKALASTGNYDVVFYGHIHEPKIEKIKDALIVNPGEIFGGLKRPTFAIYDTKSGDVRIEDLK